MKREGFAPIIALFIAMGILVAGSIAYYGIHSSLSVPLVTTSTIANTNTTSTHGDISNSIAPINPTQSYGTCAAADSGGNSSFGVLIQPNNAIGVIATNPNGVTITPDTGFSTGEEYVTEIPGEWYNSVVSVNKDGRPIRVTYSPNLLRGKYNFRVVPDATEPNKALRFNLDVMLPNTCIRLASSTAITDVPKEGYTLNLFDIYVATVVARDASSKTPRFGFVSFWQRITDGKARVTLEYIYPDSPAARAGLEKGDTVSFINGQPVITMTSNQWNELISTNNTIAVTLTRTGSDVARTITITKEIQK